MVIPVVSEPKDGAPGQELARRFFFSYGQPKRLPRRTRTRHLLPEPEVTFFDDVSDVVSDYMATPPGEHPGFLDLEHISVGQLWEPALLNMVDRCQILVVMLSPRYIESEWCRRERERFTARGNHAHPGMPEQQTMIIPVSWIPLRVDQKVPANLDPVQRFDAVMPEDPESAKLYRSLGVSRLLTEKRHADIYLEVVYQLATAICDLWYGNEVEVL